MWAGNLKGLLFMQFNSLWLRLICVACFAYTGGKNRDVSPYATYCVFYMCSVFSCLGTRISKTWLSFSLRITHAISLSVEWVTLTKPLTLAGVSCAQWSKLRKWALPGMPGQGYHSLTVCLEIRVINCRLCAFMMLCSVCWVCFSVVKVTGLTKSLMDKSRTVLWE